MSTSARRRGSGGGGSGGGGGGGGGKKSAKRVVEGGGEPEGVTFAPPTFDKSSVVSLSRDRRILTGLKGFRLVRATAGVSEGAWYCEFTVPTDAKPGGHVRVGWANDAADGHAPVGYDQHSYGYRDVNGSRLHQSMRHTYGAPFGRGDVVGCLLDFAPPLAVIQAAEETDGGASAGPLDGERQHRARQAVAAGIPLSSLGDGGRRDAAGTHWLATGVGGAGEDGAVACGQAAAGAPPSAYDRATPLDHFLVYSRQPPLPPPWVTHYPPPPATATTDGLVEAAHGAARLAGGEEGVMRGQKEADDHPSSSGSGVLTVEAGDRGADAAAMQVMKGDGDGVAPSATLPPVTTPPVITSSSSIATAPPAPPPAPFVVPSLSKALASSSAAAPSGPPNGKKVVNQRHWGSCIRFFVNGVDQGVAFIHLTKDGPAGNASAGRYYPAASCYGGGVVKFNPGPTFAFPPPMDAYNQYKPISDAAPPVLPPMYANLGLPYSVLLSTAAAAAGAGRLPGTLPLGRAAQAALGLAPRADMGVQSVRESLMGTTTSAATVAPPAGGSAFPMPFTLFGARALTATAAPASTQAPTGAGAGSGKKPDKKEKGKGKGKGSKGKGKGAGGKPMSKGAAAPATKSIPPAVNGTSATPVAPAPGASKEGGGSGVGEKRKREDGGEGPTASLPPKKPKKAHAAAAGMDGGKGGSGYDGSKVAAKASTVATAASGGAQWHGVPGGAPTPSTVAPPIASTAAMDVA